MPDNDAADALIRMMLMNSDSIDSDITSKHVSESYCVDKLDRDTLPLTYITIDKYQLKDKCLI